MNHTFKVLGQKELIWLSEDISGKQVEFALGESMEMISLDLFGQRVWKVSHGSNRMLHCTDDRS